MSNEWFKWVFAPTQHMKRKKTNSNTSAIVGTRRAHQCLFSSKYGCPSKASSAASLYQGTLSHISAKCFLKLWRWHNGASTQLISGIHDYNWWKAEKSLIRKNTQKYFPITLYQMAQHNIPEHPNLLNIKESEVNAIIMPHVRLRHFRLQTLKYFKHFIYTTQRVQ